MSVNQKLLIFLIIMNVSNLYGIDNAHFYRATNFFWDPRFEKPWLTTINVSLGSGASRTARNSDKRKTPLLNIYGLHNMRVLGKNVPGLDPANPLDKILIDLEQEPARNDFGKLEFFGRFNIIEAYLNAFQNLCYGFFLQVNIPIRQLKITNITFKDRSPRDIGQSSAFTPVWQDFLDNFDAILAQHELTIKPTNESGSGDLTLLVGWARNYEETCYLDFIDIDARTGILFPTGKKKNEDLPFDLPLGYNGFWGIPLVFNLAIGLWEWFTLGFHIDGQFLFKQTRNDIRMKTAAEQNGFIILTQGQAKIDPGTLWNVAIYTLADRFARGFSLLFGYTFSMREDTGLCPIDQAVFNPDIVKDDLLFRGWHMHVLHFMAEYDFAEKESDIGPRIGLFYNLIVGGKRVFDTDMVVGYAGIDIAWCY